jgi:hypothetical protein
MVAIGKQETKSLVADILAMQIFSLRLGYETKILVISNSNHPREQQYRIILDHRQTNVQHLQKIIEPTKGYRLKSNRTVKS